MELYNSLFRLFSGEASKEELLELTRWMEENTAANQEVMNKAYKQFLAGFFALEQMETKRTATSRKRDFAWLISIVAAACVIVGIVISHYVFVKPAQDMVGNTILLAQTEKGQRSDITLADGTKVHLNSGSRLSYPAIFYGKVRKVILEGEAMFDVKSDAEHPFIVETFAYDVKVMGTLFDVCAQEEEGEFSTALLRGKISVVDHKNGSEIPLVPNQKAVLYNGRIVVRSISGRQDDYKWTDGILSVTEVPFAELMKKMERCYGVKIVIDRETEPEIHYNYLQLRITSGIEHAFSVLKLHSDFDYRYDDTTNTYHII